MQNRRDFLKTAAFAALGSGVVINDVFGGESAPKLFNINKSGVNARMKLRFFPYELKLRHVFTVATYSRTTTPDVQVEIEYDGVIGYGEASMPPYLQKELGTMESVLAFLKKVQDIIGQFPDPFQLEDILAYVDKLSPGDAAAKAAVDIALHDLVGKLLRAPWYKIWGLDKEKAPSTTFTIGIDTPDVVREKTKECAEQFNILKVKLGRENDKEMIETIRSVTDLPIAVDANQGWTDKHYAIDMIQWLKEKGIVMIEQPMPKTQLDDIAYALGFELYDLVVYETFVSAHDSLYRKAVIDCAAGYRTYCRIHAGGVASRCENADAFAASHSFSFKHKIPQR